MTMTSAAQKNTNISVLHKGNWRKLNKVSYRRGTARRAVSLITVLNDAKMFVELHVIDKSCIRRMTFKVFQDHWKQQEYIGYTILSIIGV